MFQGYPWNIFEIEFVECSSNILKALFCVCWNLPNYQDLLSSNHSLLTQKQLFY